ncbi:MAG: hypothetical protein WCW77_02125 [Patescibacteria group bacterium]|jgi:hypothetical protein
MEKEIDFLQNPKKRKHSSGGQPRGEVEWTAPGPALIRNLENEKKPFWKRLKSYIFPFSKNAVKDDSSEEEETEIKKEAPALKLSRPVITRAPENKIFTSKIHKNENPSVGAIKKETPEIRPVYPAIKSENFPAPSKLNVFFASFFRKLKAASARLKKTKYKIEDPTPIDPKNEKKIDLTKTLKAPPAEKQKGEPKKIGGLEGVKEWPEESFKGTNLIKGIRAGDISRKAVTTLALTLASILILAATYFGIPYWYQAQAEEKMLVSEKSEKLKAEIKSKEEEMEKFLAFEKRLALAKLLLDQHIYWTSFFDFMEKNTLKDVYFGAFDAEASGDYTLEARARDFKDITKQVEILKENSLVKEAGSDGGDYGSFVSEAKDPSGKPKKAEGVNFKLRLVLDKSIFYIFKN